MIGVTTAIAAVLLGQPAGILHLVLTDGLHNFVVDVTGDQDTLERKLHISCSNCSRPVSYSEDLVGLWPIGVQQIPGDSNLVMITWESPSQLSVQVMELGETGIRKVLATGSSMIPQIVQTPENRTWIRTDSPRWLQHPTRQIHVITTWGWDGQRFTSRQGERGVP